MLYHKLGQSKLIRQDIFLILTTYFILSWDYLKISNEQNQTFGKYCGVKDGFHVIVTGDYVVLKFHSDCCVTRPGYLLSFNAFCKYAHSKDPQIRASGYVYTCCPNTVSEY